MKALWRRRLWVVLGVWLAVVAAYASAYKPAFPPTFEPRGIEFGVASTQILIDTQRSPLTDIDIPVDPLAERADLYARMVESAPVQEAIAKEGGLQPGQVVIAGRIAGSATFSRAGREQVAEQRAQDIAGEGVGRRILFSAEQGVPVLTVFAQAPKADEAIRLAQAGADGLIAYLASLQVQRATPVASRIQLRQLGAARGGMVNPGASKALAIVVWLAVFAVWCLLVLIADRLVTELRARTAADECKRCGQTLAPGVNFCGNCALPATDEQDAAATQSEAESDTRQSGTAASA